MGDLAALPPTRSLSCPGSGAARPAAAPAPDKGALGSRVGLDAEPMDTRVPVGAERRGGLGAGTSGVISRGPSPQPITAVLAAAGVGRVRRPLTPGLASKPPLAPGMLRREAGGAAAALGTGRTAHGPGPGAPRSWRPGQGRSPEPVGSTCAVGKATFPPRPFPGGNQSSLLFSMSLRSLSFVPRYLSLPGIRALPAGSGRSERLQRHLI